MEKKIVLSIGMLLLLASAAYGAVIWSDEVFTLFETTSTKPRCINGEYWEQWDNTLGELVQTNSLNDCYRVGVADGSTQKCCPYDELRCNTGTDKCELPAVDFCENYTTETECNGDDFRVGVATVERGFGDRWCGKTNGAVIAGVTCSWNNQDCRCAWKLNEAGAGSCISYYNTTAISCMNGTDDDRPGGSCELYLIEKLDNCKTTGFITFTTRVEWIGDSSLPGADECKDPPQIAYRCPAVLPFITYAGIAVAIVLIILIYFIFYKNKQRKKIVLI